MPGFWTKILEKVLCKLFSLAFQMNFPKHVVFANEFLSFFEGSLKRETALFFFDRLT